jgi:3-oxoacyl-[acyl-carrier protein] reductase
MKIAVVTGSTKGIGLAIAKGLSDAGHAVVLNWRADSKGAKAAAKAMDGREHAIVRADARKPSGARALVDAAVRRWGRLDVLVNNVGDFIETPVSELDLADFEAMYDSNVRTALTVTRAALPRLRESRGCIVNLGGTVSQLLRGNPAYAAYVMAKASLVSFTKSLAVAEGPRGVRVNMVTPGFIRTYAYSDRDVEELSPKVPLKRLGRPDEVAAAVEFLCSERASYVSGAVLDVGGALWV